LVAKRLRSADPPAVQNQSVRCARPAIARHCLAQLLFDDDGVVRLCDADAICHPQHMAIDGKPRHSQGMAEDDVGCFSSNAGQGNQRVHAGRYLTAMSLNESLGHPDQCFRLRAKETGRMNLRL
jgi:hypothetical protein